MAESFDYAQAEEIRDVFARHSVRYLFIGKSGAILLGFPDFLPHRGAAVVHSHTDALQGVGHLLGQFQVVLRDRKDPHLLGAEVCSGIGTAPR